MPAWLVRCQREQQDAHDDEHMHGVLLSLIS